MTQEYFESVYICLKLKKNTEKEIELQNSQRIWLLVYCYDKKNFLLKKRKSMHHCIATNKLFTKTLQIFTFCDSS